MAKKKIMAKRLKSKKTRRQRLKKAALPPDNPLLRHQAEKAPREVGGITDEEQARLRLKALEQTRDMPASDATEAGTDTPRGRR